MSVEIVNIYTFVQTSEDIRLCVFGNINVIDRNARLDF